MRRTLTLSTTDVLFAVVAGMSSAAMTTVATSIAIVTVINVLVDLRKFDLQRWLVLTMWGRERRERVYV